MIRITIEPDKPGGKSCVREREGILAWLVLPARQSESVNEGNATARVKLDRMLSSRFVDLTQMKSDRR
jgi:hypothetical protein